MVRSGEATRGSAWGPSGVPLGLLAAAGLALVSVLLSLTGITSGAPGEPVSALALIAAPLDHPTRKRILGHLRILPGDHMRSIARHVDVSMGEVRHHLHILHRHGLVKDRKGDGRRRFYPQDAGYDAERNALFERQWVYRDLRMRVLLRVRDRGDVSAQEVAEALQISRQLATYHLKRLAELGLVRQVGPRYFP